MDDRVWKTMNASFLHNEISKIMVKPVEALHILHDSKK